ncbi:MAG: hypothetical protein JWN56_1111 [Sphingobacteriales bacterium]|nr:hypothetical protein [Sphingobacteriales bacterium]
MKYLIIVVTIFSLTACTNHHHGARTSTTVEDGNQTVKIEDDGETLSIKVKNEEKQLDYNGSFDIKNKSSVQKKKLETHILDSLGVQLK